MTEDESPSPWSVSWHWLAVVGSVVCVVGLAGTGAAVVDGQSHESASAVVSFDHAALVDMSLDLSRASLSPLSPTLAVSLGDSTELASPPIERQLSILFESPAETVPWGGELPFELPIGPETLLDGASASAFWAWFNVGTLRSDPVPPPRQEKPGPSRGLDRRSDTRRSDTEAIQQLPSQPSENGVYAEMMLTVSAAVLSLAGAALLLYDWLTDPSYGDIEETDPVDADAGESHPVTDREQVTSLLREHDGRMRQKEIVGHVDWSKAKVSRVLSRLEEDDAIVKLRLGRENLVCLPGREPVAFQSPGRGNDGQPNK
jgi:hypothetical protein